MSDLKPLTDGENIAFANLLIAMRDPIRLVAKYRNWRGEISERTLQPGELWCGSTKWHPEPTLFLKAHDFDKGEDRDFRLADFDMKSFRRGT